MLRVAPAGVRSMLPLVIKCCGRPGAGLAGCPRAAPASTTPNRSMCKCISAAAVREIFRPSEYPDL
jgi:hypothetical protein